MKNWRKHILSFCLAAACTLAGAFTAHAQTDAMFTQFWAAQGYYNPASIALTDYVHITGGGRLQWVGIQRAPMSFVALADMPVKIGTKRLGLGASVSWESLGLYRNLNAGLQAAYRFKLLGGTLGFGVQLGLMNETFKGSEIYIPSDEEHEGNDDAIPQTDVSGNAFDVGAGIYYNHKYFWVSISATHLTEPRVSLRQQSSEQDQYQIKAPRMYYFMAGGNIPIKNTLFEIMPSVFFRTDLKDFTASASLRARWRKLVSLGAAYRWKESVALTAGVDIKNFFIGYSYEYPLTPIVKASSGSHELFVSYNLKLNLQDKNKNKHKSIRIL